LRQQLAKLEAVDPPDVCIDEQSSMEWFMKEMIAVTEQLADQENLNLTDLKAFEDRIMRARQRLKGKLEPMITRETCDP
jgi:hypothetical protein